MASQEGTNQDQMVDAGIDLREATSTAADALSNDSRIADFYELFLHLNMQGYLQGPDLVTVFAPQSVDGLAGLSDDDLGPILRKHLVSGAFTLDELRTSGTAKNLEKEPLRIERRAEDVLVNGVRVIRPDIPCTNGVVHTIERALFVS